MLGIASLETKCRTPEYKREIDESESKTRSFFDQASSHICILISFRIKYQARKVLHRKD